MLPIISATKFTELDIQKNIYYFLTKGVCYDHVKN